MGTFYIDEFVKKNNIYVGCLVKFKGDSKPYTVKNLVNYADKVFVYCDKTFNNIFKKKISDIVKVNGREIKPIINEEVQKVIDKYLKD